MNYRKHRTRYIHRNRLLLLIKKFGLTSAQIASLCCVKVGTVQGWRKDPSVVSHNTMPEGSLELLELKLGVREVEKHSL